jgi:hypothetical protein
MHAGVGTAGSDHLDALVARDELRDRLFERGLHRRHRRLRLPARVRATVVLKAKREACGRHGGSENRKGGRIVRPSSGWLARFD